MRLLARALSCAVLIAAAARVAPAQSVMPDTGTRVRVFFNEGRDYFIGWVLPSSADSLFLEGKAGDTLAVARRNIVKLQVSSGGSRAGSTLLGLTVGLGAGAGLGFAIGRPLALGGGELGAVILGTIGGATGAVVGHNAGGHWRDVAIAPIIGARGAGARIALRF